MFCDAVVAACAAVAPNADRLRNVEDGAHALVHLRHARIVARLVGERDDVGRRQHVLQAGRQRVETHAADDVVHVEPDLAAS